MFKARLSRMFHELYKMFRDESEPVRDSSPEVVRKSEIYLGDAPIAIRFYKASGGLVVQVITTTTGSSSPYSTINSCSKEETNLYIIEHGKNIGEELEKILTVTQLSR